MNRVVYFTRRFFNEMKKLVKKAPDLPAEILRILPLIDSGHFPMTLVSASSSRSWLHCYFRIGSKTQAMGKRKGYRVQVIKGLSEMRFFCIYLGHDNQDFISEEDKKAIKKAIEADTVSELSCEWYMRDDIVEEFIGPQSEDEPS